MNVLPVCGYYHCRKHVVDPVWSQLINLDKFAKFFPEETARWRHNSGSCCEWCDAFIEHAPQLHYEIETGGLPFVLWPIGNEYQIIHDYFKNERVGDPTNYLVSCDIERLSQMLWQYWQFDPSYWEFPQLSEQLRDMAVELQIGPPRELYHTMPKINFPGY
ncbi:hypothetical protein CC80DRAFT_537134 [Byssothecium circinans]|uniref:Uncharacterized protein n=1 Tax=Byssothecium circinans TaxID=147558 RepID=A0A6A5TMF2_9PLEO|nr:hypothetical protein CC80DRAFT_537134 [Byssothecium circinans]